MKTTVKITGMTCGHCEGRVTTELSKISGVSELTVSAEKGEATFVSADAIEVGNLESAIRTAGYTFVDSQAS